MFGNRKSPQTNKTNKYGLFFFFFSNPRVYHARAQGWKTVQFVRPTKTYVFKPESGTWPRKRGQCVCWSGMGAGAHPEHGLYMIPIQIAHAARMVSEDVSFQYVYKFWILNCTRLMCFFFLGRRRSNFNGTHCREIRTSVRGRYVVHATPANNNRNSHRDHDPGRAVVAFSRNTFSSRGPDFGLLSAQRCAIAVLCEINQSTRVLPIRYNHRV